MPKTRARTTPNSLPVSFLLFYLVFFSATSTGQEAPDEQEMIRLVERLGHADFEERDKAGEALLRIGEAAWPVAVRYLNNDDPELAGRVKELAQYIAVPLGDEVAKARNAVEKLEDAKDDTRRAEGLDELITLGPPGLRILRRHLSSGGARLGIDFRINNKVLVGLGAIEGQLQIVNSGTGVLWAPKHGYGQGWRLSEPMPFGEKRPLGGVGFAPTIGLGGGGGGSFKYRSPIRDWVVVPPGGVVKESTVQCKLTTQGCYVLTLEAYLSPATTIHPRIPGSEKTIALTLLDGPKADARRVLETHEVVCLPDSNEVPDDKRLEMRVVNATRGPLVPGSSLKVDVHLRNRNSEKELYLEQGLIRYAWYVLVREGHGPVAHGSWRSARPQEGEPRWRFPEMEKAAAEGKKLEVTIEKEEVTGIPMEFGPYRSDEDKWNHSTPPISAGGTLVWSQALPVPDTPGTYTLYVGYEVPARAVGEFSPAFIYPKDAEKQKQLILLEDARFITVLRDLKVMKGPQQSSAQSE